MTSHHSSGVSHVTVVLFLFLLCKVSLCAVNVDHINVGFSASAIRWVDTNGMFLYSINHSFALGFSSLGSGGGASYYLCILHLSSTQNVWYANRNQPVQITDSFYFETDGSVALQDSRGAVVWSSNATGGSSLQLQETGNLVLFNNNDDVLWQSFDHPTDTLLTGQKFSPNMKLVASSSQTDISEGSYYMSMDESGLALHANISSPQVFWTMASDGKNSQLVPGGVPAFATITNNTLVLVESDDVTIVSEILLDSYQGSTIRRATLEYDGNLRVYFLSGSLWNLAYWAVRDDCDLPDTCGAYGLCSSNGQCSCPKPSVPNNGIDISLGCSTLYAPTCNDKANLTFLPLELFYAGNIDYYANQYTQPQGTYDLDACKQACMDNCSCTALFFYNATNSCFLWGQLDTLKDDSDNNHLAFFKVPQNLVPSFSSHSNRNASRVIILIAVGTCFIITGLLVGAWRLHKRRLAGQVPSYAEDDDLIDTISGLPTRFSYKELEVATNSFRLKLGSGGFGSVYEGLLADNTKIAVKRLESFGQGKKEFVAEVATIGSIHHVHLVQLRGFCAEGSHLLLVYEFMANGSLAKVLFSTSKDEIVLDWDTRCKISAATARGLAYLHDDCRERILHCDIKPENILLDEHLVAKVSDFGLAKLMNPEQSEVFTTLRGTRGYLAPEWLSNAPISDKSDVYSFGMVLLELISGRKNSDLTEMSEKGYFPIYAFRQTEVGNVQVLADPKLNGHADEEQVAKLTRIALWCIQDVVAIRPSMKKVVKMIEGIVEVGNPPSSPQLAVRLHGRQFDSGNDSAISDFDSGGLSATRLSGPR